MTERTLYPIEHMYDAVCRLSKILLDEQYPGSDALVMDLMGRMMDVENIFRDTELRCLALDAIVQRLHVVPIAAPTIDVSITMGHHHTMRLALLRYPSYYGSFCDYKKSSYSYVFGELKDAIGFKLAHG
jgi:hypothetical protein